MPNRRSIRSRMLIAAVTLFGTSSWTGCAAPAAEEITPAHASESKTPRRTDRVEILQFLETGMYAELDRMLTEIFDAARVDVAYEIDARVAQKAFDTADARVGARLKRWTEKHPESAVARVAYAEHLVARASAARGTKWSNETSREQFDAMATLISGAHTELDEALRLEPRSIEAWLTHIGIAANLGRHREVEQAGARALEVSPASYRARSLSMFYGRPRWGGSWESVAKFAAESQRWADENPRLRALEGFVEWDKGRYAASDGRNEEALEHYDRAIAAGDSDYFYEARGRARRRLDDDDGALADFERALELLPQDPDLLLERAWTLSDLGRSGRAFRDLDLATRIDPAHKDIESTVDHILHRVAIHATNLIKTETAPDLAHASALLERILERDPTHAWGLYKRARIAELRKDPAAAEADYLTCAKANLDFIQCYKKIHSILADREEWAALREHWDRFVAATPDEANAYRYRSAASRHLGDSSAADDDLRQACELGSKRACESVARRSL